MKKFLTLTVVALAFAVAGQASAASMLSAHTGTNLMVGSRGARVMELQLCMNTAGFSTGVVDGIYGPKTKAGVMSFQATKGLVVDGIVGVMTTPMFQAACMTGEMEDEDEDDDDNDSPVFNTNNGEEADFSDFDLDDADDDTIEEGQEEAIVAEIEFDLEDDGAAMLERFDFTVVLDAGQTLAEEDAWEVFDKVYLMVDGDVIAEMDADDEDDWDDSTAGDDARFRMNGINHVFDADETHTIEIAVDVAGSVDLEATGDADWKFFVYDNSLRFIDEAGITLYLTEEDGINGDTAAFTIEEEGQDDELTIRESDNDPEATALQVEDDEKSDWYNIFTFEGDVDEDSQDLEFKEVVLTVSVEAAAGKNVSDVVNDMKIALDGNESDDYALSAIVAATATTPATAVVTFDTEDEDFMIDADDTEDFELWAEFKAANGTNYTQGVTVMAEVTSLNGDVWDVEGGDDLDATQIKGAAQGEEHTLLVDGAVVTLNSATESVSSSSNTTQDDTAKFGFKINVEAFDEPVYIPVVAANAFTYAVIDAATDTAAAGTPTVSIASSATKVTGADSNDYFKVSSDKDFTISITTKPGANKDSYAELSTLNFTSDDVTATGFTFTATPIVLDDDEFRTDVVTTLS